MKFEFAAITSAIALATVATAITLPLAGTRASKVAVAWHAGWHEDQFGPKNVSWSKYTHLIYAFAVITEDPARIDESGLAGLPSFVQTAHRHGKRAILSFGGWTGSRFFSTAVNSEMNRGKFVKAIVDIAVKYKVDGLDFDWEYPNGRGIGCNNLSPYDTPNFLLFLKELRSHPVAKSFSISAAVATLPWLGEDGNPVNDVSAFAKVLDYVAIMNYDTWGSWSSTVGPNAPLDDSCAATANRAGSATSAVNIWKKAGMPNYQIVLGIPSYGHSFRVRKSAAFVGGPTGQLALFPPFDPKNVPVGDKWDAKPGDVDVCGVKSDQPGGTVQFWGMINLGYLNEDGTPKAGQHRLFDSCSKTPFIYNQEEEIMVSYDDPESMIAKGKFIKENNLRGFSIWEAGGDYNDLLLNAIRNGAGDGPRG